MSHAMQYNSDSEDSEAQNTYSDNEGIMFAGSRRKKAAGVKAASEPSQKSRGKPSSQRIPNDLDETHNELEGGKPKKRRRTAEVTELPFHDEEDYVHMPNAPIKFKSRIWTDEMDNDLDLAAKEFDRDWGLVCARLNDKFSTHLTNSQCQKRWTQYVSPEIMDRKAGPWSADEISLLHILVEQHSRDVQGKVRISWDTVSRLINRRYYDCQNKWNTIKKANLKVGRFTVDEDELIRRTVTEWDGNGVRQGLWISLQNELGRRNDVIRKRWQTVLSKRGTNGAATENFASSQP